MILDLRKMQEPSGQVSGTDRVEFDDALEERVVLSCDVDVKYNQTGGSYYLHVGLGALYRTLCNSCLEPVVYPLESEFDLVIRRSSDRAAEVADDSESAGANDYVTIGAKDYEVSLHPFIHENLVVSIPIRILCNDDCRGLCPQCGSNLNSGECGCQSSADPRWDALKKLSDE